MRRIGPWAALAAVAVVATACLGGASHHPTLSANEALAQVRNDGFVTPKRDSAPPSWRCDGRTSDQGPTQPAGRYADYVRPSYALGLTDRRIPAGPENTARIAMLVIVFPDRATARRCADAGIYQMMHIPVDRTDPVRAGPPYRPYKLIDSTTIETSMHAPGAPGFEFAEDTGEYDTYVVSGRVFGLGLAYNEPHSKIVREDLERIAAEIAG
jgi:hypothetical protein